jgi:transcriptional regulator with XRE-family HTH domain
MGMQHPYISEMERGLKVPSLTTILRLAVALKCEVTDLVDIFNGRDLRKLIPKRK